jgi:hypothetical protein
VGGETHYGRYAACDAVECGGSSIDVCASEDCCNFPCLRHAKRCPGCGKCFCESSDKTLWTCFSDHIQEGKCEGDILLMPLGRLTDALNSGKHCELEHFVCRDSDGLGHPLPREAYTNMGLGVLYSKNVIPEYNGDIVLAHRAAARARRARAQRLRRSRQRLGIPSAASTSSESSRLAPYKNSTVHLVSGALVVLHWTGNWHYKEQTEMLGIMGLSKSQDFVRDRVDYLQASNPALFQAIDSWASRIRKRL